MRTVVRQGQRTWCGRNKQEVLAAANKRETEGARTLVAEIMYRERDLAAFMRHNAARMAP
jgi:hypothetical protein